MYALSRISDANMFGIKAGTLTTPVGALIQYREQLL